MNISILGTGGWGLALGKILHGNGHKISFWTPSDKEVALLISEHEYKDKLPGVELPKDFVYSTNMQQVLEAAEMVVFACPSEFIESTSVLAGNCKVKANIIAVSATKGISEQSLRMSEVILKQVPWLSQDAVIALSGPTHAEELARGTYTAIVAASVNENAAKSVQKIFSNSFLRVYTSKDIIGVELCGSVKNVIAIAGGIIDGLGENFGDNTKAALITRGQAEIRRLGEAMGANQQTFSGLAGIGDLIVTCASKHSRNRFVGEQIGKGKSLNDILSKMTMIAEGVPTAKSVYALSQKMGIEMPISNTVFNILFNGLEPRNAVNELMSRELKAEE